MGDRLAHREEALLQVELAPEQHRDEVGRATAARRRRATAASSSASRAS